MKPSAHLHPANAEELATIAQETGAEVLRGALRYPSESGGWQLGGLDLSEHLEQYRDQELIVIIGSLGKGGTEQVTCGICGFALDDVGECPRCRLVIYELSFACPRGLSGAMLLSFENELEVRGLVIGNPYSSVALHFQWRSQGVQRGAARDGQGDGEKGEGSDKEASNG